MVISMDTYLAAFIQKHVSIVIKLGCLIISWEIPAYNVRVILYDETCIIDAVFFSHPV